MRGSTPARASQCPNRIGRSPRTASVEIPRRSLTRGEIRAGRRQLTPCAQIVSVDRAAVPAGAEPLHDRRTMTEAYLLGGVRTPFARYGGSLSHLRLDDLLGLALAGACGRGGGDRDQIEDIIAGCVNPAPEGMGDLARRAAPAAGFPAPPRG